jgi:hypothetical protein
MSNWQRIREERSDVTDFLVHLTRFVVRHQPKLPVVQEGFLRLKAILKSGYLLPTNASRVTTIAQRISKTIRGDFPAVCFTEQPLEQIPVSLRGASAGGYEGYGIAFHRVDLQRYGARHVIYGDYHDLNKLSDDMKYRWVPCLPIRPEEGGYPNDFSVEREWRCKVQTDHERLPWEHPLVGVPILLPDDFRRVAFESSKFGWIFRKRPPEFRIIVARDTEVEQLRAYIEGLKDCLSSRSLYHRIFWLAASKAQIISLQHVKRRLAKNDPKYRKIETLQGPAKRPNVVPMGKLAVTA